MEMKDIKFPPTGRNAAFIVNMDGAPYAGFDTMNEAKKFIEMQMSKLNKSSPANAANRKWTINS
jgi:hypothetical protein